MKRRQHKGFTLIEVLIGFILLSFIVVMVCSVMATSFVVSTRVHELPNAYYGAQNEAEEAMDELSSLVKMHYRLLNEINNTAAADLDPEIPARLEDVDRALEAYAKEPVTLFGKNVEIYKVDVDYVSPEGPDMILYTGVVDAQGLERLVPIIDKVVITVEGSSSVNGSNADAYFAVGKNAQASVSYNSKNQSYRAKELYQWYIGTEGFHTVEYLGDPHLEDEHRAGTVYTNYPNCYTLLPGETKASIQIKEEYCGQLLVCVVTPLSKNGAMGESKVSSPLYISAFPKPDQGNCRLFLDVSAQGFNYTENPTIKVSALSGDEKLKSRSVWTADTFGQPGKFIAEAARSPVVNLDGAPTVSGFGSTSLTISPLAEGAYTRFISFTSSTEMTFDESPKRLLTTMGGTPRAFAVVRNNESPRRDVDFVFVDGTALRTIRQTSGNSETGWQVIEMEMRNGTTSQSLSIGRANVDLAEFIVLGNPSTQFMDEVWNYLLEKYNIRDDSRAGI